MSNPMGCTRIALAAVVLALSVAAAPAVQADQSFFVTLLQGSQEVPPVATTAEGTALVYFDPATNKLHWIVQHDVASPTGAHFHGPAFPGAEAAILVDIGALSGGLTSPMVGQATLTAPQAADLLAGRWYMNVHSSANVDGEIRGQVSAFTGTALLIFPGSGEIPSTASFDLTLLLNLNGKTPTGGRVAVDGADVTAALGSCIRVGTLFNESGTPSGITARCRLPGGALVPGPHVVSAVIDFSDGSSVGNTVSWFIAVNTEP